MTVAKKKDKSGAPTFTTEIPYVEVDIDPDELENAGWVFVGEGGPTAAENRSALAVVQAWHDREHTGPWAWCQHELCYEIGRG